MPEPDPPASQAEPVNNSALRHAWRLVVLVVGGTICLLGAAMLVLPGPGIIGIVAGISILATEFGWARRLLRQARQAIGAGGAEREKS